MIEILLKVITEINILEGTEDIYYIILGMRFVVSCKKTKD